MDIKTHPDGMNHACCISKDEIHLSAELNLSIVMNPLDVECLSPRELEVPSQPSPLHMLKKATIISAKTV